ncbi:MAG: amidohydrolase family protein [bacterium]
MPPVWAVWSRAQNLAAMKMAAGMEGPEININSCPLTDLLSGGRHDKVHNMMNTKNLIAIDTHSHYNTGSEFDTKTDATYSADLNFLRKTSQNAKIGPIFASTFSSVLNRREVVSENHQNFLAAQKYPWLYQWVVVEPDNDESFAQAGEMLKNKKCVGIKIHSVCHNYSIKAHGEKIFSFAAENQAIVLMHPPSYSDKSELEDLLPFANAYSTMTLIIAHLGSVEQVEVVKRAAHGNVYLDTSGNASTKNQVIEYAVSEIGSEKILFGTDTYAVGFQRGRIEYAMISARDKQNILRYNALKLFKDKLPADGE